MKIIRITDSKNNKRLDNKQTVSKKWIEKNLNEQQLLSLKNGDTIGVTVRKGKGFSRVTLKATTI